LREQWLFWMLGKTVSDHSVQFADFDQLLHSKLTDDEDKEIFSLQNYCS